MFQIATYSILAVDEWLLGAIDETTGALRDVVHKVVPFQAGFGGNGDMTLQW